MDALSRGTAARDLPPEHAGRVVKSSWDALSIRDGLVFEGNRIFLPKPARRQVLETLHMGHPGYHKMRETACQLYTWPGMTQAIREIVDLCENCQERRPSQQREPLVQTKASFPMQMMSADIFHHLGKNYLVVVDRYSGFPFVERMHGIDGKAVCEKLQSIFIDWGIPQTIRTDDGPCFRSTFATFCKENGVCHETSSAYYPVSNGHAERYVGLMKGLLAKCDGNWDRFRQALLEWRNASRTDCKLSPAQLMLGRRQRTRLPAGTEAYGETPGAVGSDAEGQREHAREREKQRLDRSARQLDALKEGDLVRIQDPQTGLWTENGTVASVREDGRSYIVQNDRGRSLLRNRRDLKPRSQQRLRFNEVVQVRAEADVGADVAVTAPASTGPRRSSRLREKKEASQVLGVRN